MNFLIFSLPEVDSLYAKQFIFHKYIELKSKVITQGLSDQSKSEIIVYIFNLFWLLELFAKNAVFLDILVLFKPVLGQISFNPVENVYATQQLAFLATSIAFYHIVTRGCVEPTSLGFLIFGIFFSPSFFLLFFSFCCSDWLFTVLACG